MIKVSAPTMLSASANSNKPTRDIANPSKYLGYLG
jgi:hypothetical protein